MKEFQGIQAAQMNMALALMHEGTEETIEAATEILHMIVDDTSRFESLYQKGILPLHSEAVTHARRQHYFTPEEQDQQLQEVRQHTESTLLETYAHQLIDPYVAGDEHSPIIETLRGEKATLYQTMKTALSMVGVSIQEASQASSLSPEKIRYIGDQVIQFDRHDLGHRRYRMNDLAKLVIAGTLNNKGFASSEIVNFLKVPRNNAGNTTPR